MKRAYVSERNTELPPAPEPTKTVREQPTTSLACTHTETARTHARQGGQEQRGKDTASECSRTHCSHGGDECGFHRVPAPSDYDEECKWDHQGYQSLAL